MANERLEGGLVNFFSFVDVDRAACVSVETRVEETGRILQRRALGEGKLHDLLVGFASADDAVVRPNRSAHPLPLLDDVRVCFLDELAHSAEGFPAPVPEFGDSFRDELRCRLPLARARLFHVLTTGGAECFPGEVSYGASKNALESYTRAAGKELARFGVTANLIVPGATQTGWITTADALVREIERLTEVSAFQSDLLDASAPARLFDRAEQTFGRVDILINNAAHCIGDTFIPADDSRDWGGRPTVFIDALSIDRHFAVNVRATALLIAEFARRYVARGAKWGRIISIRSRDLRS
ncbi:MAG TPA: SDR family NAD(P)-dependent oxidoreductase [Candidatus Binataceae bacterium]